MSKLSLIGFLVAAFVYYHVALVVGSNVDSSIGVVVLFGTFVAFVFLIIHVRRWLG
ncbi:hypothetical protein VB773_14445 [Haloarculaceae archaeon H-GB2-1]|nr:hypothetical protein [Haloarculaceae archaeon H-GB1-1]MEA5387157.1 hypothetical protein [Haloarculaceae archaeon H-GB11]MEA5408650.1 hypothetical protein [Haloarculaceae archaeon H-GB2-1]